MYDDIGKLQSSNTENTEKRQDKLKKFREKAEKKHCKYWSTSEDLGGKVSRSLIQLRKKHPSDGWVPGKYATDEKMLRELDQLRSHVRELENEAALFKYEPPPNTENLQSGNDEIGTIKKLITKKGSTNKDEYKWFASYDKLFSYAGTALIGECDEKEFEKK